jgi:hypothetical protein
MCQISLYSTSFTKRLLDRKDSNRISNGRLQYSTLINKSFRQKTTKKPELNATTEKTDCRVFLPTATQYTFFPAVYGRCGMMNIFLFFVFSSHLCVHVCVCMYVCVFMLMSTFFFFGFWTQGFMLARQAVYRLNHIYSPFCSGYFGDRISCFAQASLKHDPHILGFPPLLG